MPGSLAPPSQFTRLAVAFILSAMILSAGSQRPPHLPLPLTFEPNQGQADPAVRYLSRAPGYTLFLTGRDAVMQSGTATVRLQFVGANAAMSDEALDRLPGVSNYFTSLDPKQWRTGIPQYGRVRYHGLYSGIDVDYYGRDGQLEYDLRLAPGADAGRIRLSFPGAERLRVSAAGDLVLEVAGRQIVQHRPVAFQTIGGRQIAVSSRYVLSAKRQEVRLMLGKYDRAAALLIDPVLVYSTYVPGGYANDFAGIATDAGGNTYLAGTTGQGTYLTTAGAYQTADCSNSCVFIVKLNPAGTAILYSTLFGSSVSAAPSGLAVDAQGNAYITGLGTSFPVTPGAWRTATSGPFAAKLSADGAKLLYSTSLDSGPVPANTVPAALAVDSAGDAFVVGRVFAPGGLSTTRNAYQPSYGGGTSDGFVIGLNPTGTAPLYETYLGGSSTDLLLAAAADASGNVTITGGTSSANYPTTANAIPHPHSGNYMVFATRLALDGSAVYSTLFGGGTLASDTGMSIALDRQGNAYIAGDTGSLDFPTTAGAYRTASGPGFLTKLDATGSSLLYSTYLPEQTTSLAVDALGNAVVGGNTYFNPQLIPITADAIQPTPLNSHYTGYIMRFDTRATTVTYGTYLGGSQDFNDRLLGLAIDPAGVLHVGGLTPSLNFPTTPGTVQPVLAGGIVDMYATAIDLSAADACPVVVSAVTGNTSAAGGLVTLTTSAASNCAYTVSSTTPWVTVSSGASGSGSRTVTVSLDPNPDYVSRTANLLVGGVFFPLTQAAIACTYTFFPASASLPTTGGTYTVAVTASPASCPIAPHSNSQNILILSTYTMAAPATITYTVNPNTTTQPIVGAIILGNQSFQVTEAAGTGCSYLESVGPLVFTPAGGSGTVSVSAQSGCPWTILTSASWLTFPSGASGSGSGSVPYTVAPDPGIGRTAAIVLPSGNRPLIRQPGAQDGAALVITGSSPVVNAGVSYSLPAGSITKQFQALTISGGLSPIGFTYTVSGTPRFASVPVSLNPTPAQVFVVADPTGLTPGGTYVNTVTFASTGLPSVSYTVSLTIQPSYASKAGIYRASAAGLLLLDTNGDAQCCTGDVVGSIGAPGDIPLSGDWNGSGAKQFGLYRPSTGLFLLDKDGNGAFDPLVDQALILAPQPGDIPVVGDWTGTGVDRAGIYRAGTWYLDTAGDGSFSGRAYLGQAGDIPIVGNWSGTATRMNVGIYRPSSVNGQPGNFFLVDSNGDGQYTSADRPLFFLGQAGDLPVVGDWSGNGSTKVGIFRPSTGLFILDQNGNFAYDGAPVDSVLFFAPYLNGTAVSTAIQPGDLPITGIWADSYAPLGSVSISHARARTGIYRSSTGTFFLDSTADGTYQGRAYLGGQAGDLPIGTPLLLNRSVVGVNTLGSF